MPSTPGTKIAASLRSGARAAPSRAVRTRVRPATSRGIAGRDVSGFFGFLFLYQAVTSTAALHGYFQYLTGATRRWK